MTDAFLSSCMLFKDWAQVERFSESMLQINGLWAFFLTIAFEANAFDTSIFAFDSHQPPIPGKSTVTDIAGRQLVEHRVAPSDAWNLGRTDEETVKLLNRFGGPSPPLFGISENENQRSTIILEGVAPEVGSLVQEEYPGTYVVSHSSPALMVENFLDSFLEMKFESEAELDKRHCIFYASKKITKLSDALQNDSHCSIKDQVLQDMPDVFEDLLGHADMVEFWVSHAQSETVMKVLFEPPGNSSEATFMTESLKSLFLGLSAAESKQVTAVLLPGTSKPKKSNADLRTRNFNKREGPLKSVGSKFEQNSIPSALAFVCHASEASCKEATNNCSGHGLCYRKSGSGDGTTVGDCYACRCQQTTIKNKDGTIQKVQWAGSACQKRDISSPFFLIAGVTVIGTVAISTAVGLLFKIGQDELPGVISAGVGS